MLEHVIGLCAGFCRTEEFDKFCWSVPRVLPPTIRSTAFGSPTLKSSPRVSGAVQEGGQEELEAEEAFASVLPGECELRVLGFGIQCSVHGPFGGFRCVDWGFCGIFC